MSLPSMAIEAPCCLQQCTALASRAHCRLVTIAMKLLFFLLQDIYLSQVHEVLIHCAAYHLFQLQHDQLSEVHWQQC